MKDFKRWKIFDGFTQTFSQMGHEEHFMETQ